jgi:hypothetical protein
MSTGSTNDALLPLSRSQHVPYFVDLFEIFNLDPIVWIEKTRDMMVPWTCVAYLCWKRSSPRVRRAQTQKADKAIQLVRSETTPALAMVGDAPVQR